ncbi:hypothetical protein L195_g046373 [Trifolium pratense]|uniref:Uncharacterized protein n=1 Tax=Trifolium pratense TaxID=57577 RepID=A0A2K3MHH3_TRIPR|nr:hypothetical protein L195_g046373 [Trifolium pratense]
MLEFSADIVICSRFYAGRTCDCSGLIQAGALQNATVAELDTAQTYSAAVNVGMSLDVLKLSLYPSVSLN